MKINELRLLNIKIFDNGEIVYEGMSENTPTEYKDIPIKIIGTGNVVELEILHEQEEKVKYYNNKLKSKFEHCESSFVDMKKRNRVCRKVCVNCHNPFYVKNQKLVIDQN